MALVPSDIEKLKTSQYLRFIDVTPLQETPTWAVIGIGVEEATTSYNPNVDRIKWIIEDSARSDHTSNDKQASITQKAYKNDPCFEFINKGRDKLNYKTHILEIDMWNVTEDEEYRAKKSDGLVVINDYSGDGIGYDLYFDGDPEEGTATVVEGNPVFTKSNATI